MVELMLEILFVFSPTVLCFVLIVNPSIKKGANLIVILLTIFGMSFLLVLVQVPILYHFLGILKGEYQTINALTGIAYFITNIFLLFLLIAISNIKKIKWRH